MAYTSDDDAKAISAELCASNLQERGKADAQRQAVECVELSDRDSLRVLHLLERPPEPNARLKAAANYLD